MAGHNSISEEDKEKSKLRVLSIGEELYKTSGRQKNDAEV